MISIVIPLYNKEQSIIRTIDGVLAQTYQFFEVIIVNDGSTDGSLEVVKGIKDERIVIINKENGGVSSARNAGIKAAKYDYIAFLDGDDLWLPYHLEILHRMINDHKDPAIGAYATKFIRSNDPDLLIKTSPQIFKEDLVIDNYIKEASVTNGLISSSNSIVKKECFYNVGFYDENLSYSEDVELWYRLFKKYKLVTNNSLTEVYFAGAENRSNKVMPLSKRFHKFDFNNKPAYEKKYLTKLVSIVILDYLMMGAYKIAYSVFLMYKKYWVSILKYFSKLILKRYLRIKI